MDCGDLSLPIPSVVGRVEHMELQFGQETVLCSALVVGESASPSPPPVFLCTSCPANGIEKDLWEKRNVVGGW